MRVLPLLLLVAPIALLIVVLAGCGRGDDSDRRTDASASPDTASAGDADADAARAEQTEPAPRLRSLALSQAGWRFQLDLAADADRGTRVEVLTTPATVGAAPLRWTTELPGEFVEAFATDLDSDAWPELLLWQRSGSAGEGLVEGWRMRADGGIDALALPALEGDLAVGWRGRDQFGVHGARLVRSFPLYRDGDDNASPSAGFLRVLRYRLGATGLVVDESMLEPMDGSPQAELLAR